MRQSGGVRIQGLGVWHREGTEIPVWGGAGATSHLELDGEFVGAEHKAGGEEHSTLLLGDRFGALSLTSLDFLQELWGHGKSG